MKMKSLYFKFAVTTISIMLLSGLISFLLSNYYYQINLKQKNDEKISNFASEVSHYINHHDEIDLTKYIEHIGLLGYQIYIVDEQGETQFFGSAYRDKDLPASIVDKVLNGDTYHGIKHFPHNLFVTGFFANELKNTIGVPFEFEGKDYALFIRPDIKLFFNEMHLLFAFMLALTIALSIVLVLISTKYLIRPISKLNSATKDIANGNFSISLDITRKDEIGDLAASFDDMTKKLAKVEEMRKELISNISHDIQSPLSNMRGYVNLLDASSAEERSHYIEILNTEINRLSSLTKQMLLLSTIESKKEIMEVKEFDLGDQLKKVISQYQWQLSEKGIMVSYSSSNVMIKGDPSLLYTVWENLLTNAIKYNHEYGEIEIAAQEKDSRVLVSMKDTGIGLEPNQVKRIYDRFYRGDHSRTRSVDGTGLGLSIVQSVVEMHSGEISVESVEGKGTVFYVSLPKL
jgi:signal transduction histidine kinase